MYSNACVSQSQQVLTGKKSCTVYSYRDKVEVVQLQFCEDSTYTYYRRSGSFAQRDTGFWKQTNDTLLLYSNGDKYNIVKTKDDEHQIMINSHNCHGLDIQKLEVYYDDNTVIPMNNDNIHFMLDTTKSIDSIIVQPNYYSNIQQPIIINEFLKGNQLILISFNQWMFILDKKHIYSCDRFTKLKHRGHKSPLRP